MATSTIKNPYSFTNIKEIAGSVTGTYASKLTALKGTYDNFTEAEKAKSYIVIGGSWQNYYRYYGNGKYSKIGLSSGNNILIEVIDMENSKYFVCSFNSSTGTVTVSENSSSTLSSVIRLCVEV